MQLGEARFSGFTWRPLGRRNPVVAGLDLTIGPGERVLLGVLGVLLLLLLLGVLVGSRPLPLSQ